MKVGLLPLAKGVARTLVALCALIPVWLSGLAWGVELPVHTTFEGDVVGQPPSLGGPNQPTDLWFDSGLETITVEENELGLPSKSVVMTSGAIPAGEHRAAGATWEFDPVASGIFRLEATISIGTAVSGNHIGLQFWEPGGPVISRLNMTGDQLYLQTAEGPFYLDSYYEANSPFRVRYELDVDNWRLSIVIDEELDGFDNDVVVTGFAFTNDPSAYGEHKVGGVGAGFSMAIYPFDRPAYVIAYDDVLIQVVPEPATLGVMGLAALALLLRRRKA